MSKLIPLTKGYSAIVDDEDYDYLMQWKWYAHIYQKTNKVGTPSTYAHIYAQRWELKHQLGMHRVVLGLGTDDTRWLIDHINHNGLDNRKTNLRVCTNTQNIGNSRPKAGSSKYKGVHYCLTRKVWVSRLTNNGKVVYIGQFQSELEAALAFDDVAIKTRGEFALTNKSFYGIGG